MAEQPTNSLMPGKSSRSLKVASAEYAHLTTSPGKRTEFLCDLLKADGDFKGWRETAFTEMRTQLQSLWDELQAAQTESTDAEDRRKSFTKQEEILARFTQNGTRPLPRPGVHLRLDSNGLWVQAGPTGYGIFAHIPYFHPLIDEGLLEAITDARLLDFIPECDDLTYLSYLFRTNDRFYANSVLESATLELAARVAEHQNNQAFLAAITEQQERKIMSAAICARLEDFHPGPDRAYIMDSFDEGVSKFSYGLACGSDHLPKETLRAYLHKDERRPRLPGYHIAHLLRLAEETSMALSQETDEMGHMYGSDTKRAIHTTYDLAQVTKQVYGAREKILTHTGYPEVEKLVSVILEEYTEQELLEQCKVRVVRGVYGAKKKRQEFIAFWSTDPELPFYHRILLQPDKHLKERHFKNDGAVVRIREQYDRLPELKRSEFEAFEAALLPYIRLRQALSSLGYYLSYLDTNRARAQVTIREIRAIALSEFEQKDYLGDHINGVQREGVRQILKALEDFLAHGTEMDSKAQLATLHGFLQKYETGLWDAPARQVLDRRIPMTNEELPRSEIVFDQNFLNALPKKKHRSYADHPALRQVVLIRSASSCCSSENKRNRGYLQSRGPGNSCT
ncbi:MAG: hypothetical protein AAB421_01925 [Patescibacteria group bacterium]